jgi:hypothetical protein
LHEGMSADPTEMFQEGKEKFPKEGTPNSEGAKTNGETSEIESFPNLETCPRRA